MTRRSVTWWVLLGIVGLAAGCVPEEDTDPTGASSTGTLVVDAAWARPGTEDGMSAVYFRIANGTGTPTRRCAAYR